MEMKNPGIEIPELEKIFRKDDRLYSLFTDGTVLPVVRGGDADDEFDDSDVDDDSDTDETEENDSEADEDSEEDEPKGKSKTVPASRFRRMQKRLANEKAAREAAEKKLKDAGSDEETQASEKLREEHAELQKRNESLQEISESLLVRSQVMESLGKHKLNPLRIKAIMKVLEVDDLEVDLDEAEVDGIDEALEAIAEEYPEWVLKAKKEADEEDDDDEEEKPKRKPSGEKPKQRRKGSGQMNREALLKKYPGLRG